MTTPASVKVATVIPAFNESATIRDVVARAMNQAEMVIVVDDGSTDGTAAAIEDLPVHIVRNPDNQGKAASLLNGIRHAIDCGAESIITLDADGQHAPEDIPRLRECAEKESSAIVIGARTLNRKDAPLARSFANHFADFWISWAAGRKIRDSQSGFRLYPARLFREIPFAYDRRHGFVFESEVLIAAAWRGFAVRTVPIAAVYPKGARPSHFRPVADIAQIVRMVARRLLQRKMHVRGFVNAFLRRN